MKDTNREGGNTLCLGGDAYIAYPFKENNGDTFRTYQGGLFGIYRGALMGQLGNFGRDPKNFQCFSDGKHPHRSKSQTVEISWTIDDLPPNNLPEQFYQFSSLKKCRGSSPLLHGS